MKRPVFHVEGIPAVATWIMVVTLAVIFVANVFQFVMGFWWAWNF